MEDILGISVVGFLGLLAVAWIMADVKAELTRVFDRLNHELLNLYGIVGELKSRIDAVAPQEPTDNVGASAMWNCGVCGSLVDEYGPSEHCPRCGNCPPWGCDMDEDEPLYGRLFKP